MASRHKGSCVKKRKSIVLEKLSDNSDNTNSKENESQIKQKKGKKIRSKIANSSSNNNKNENCIEKRSKHFPIKNIYEPQLFINNLEELERYKCGLCENICFNPRYQYCPCDQVYCKECLDIYYDCYHNQCPKCQRVTKELIPKETFFEKLMKLKMICRNHIYQCQWSGIYENYKNHIENECPKETINCPNRGCAIKLRREEMPYHVQKCEYREFICSKCLTKMAYIEKKTHKNFCPRAEILCPQNCGAYIEREDFSDHKKICKNSDIHCPYKVFGCKDKYQRNKKDERLVQDTSKHLDLTFKIILDLQKKVNQLEKTIQEMKNNYANKGEMNKINNNNENMEINQNSINQIEDNKNQNEFLEKKRLISNEMKEDMKAPNSANYSIFNFLENENEPYETNNIINKDGIFPENAINDNYIYDIPKKYEHLFKIEDDIIETRSLDGTKHYFVFFNRKFDIPENGSKKYSFTFKLLKNCDFVEMGICDKKIIEMNNFEFDSKRNNIKGNRGVYSITSNQRMWNSNNDKECIKFNYYKPLSKIGTMIIITFDPQNCTLEFFLNNEDFFVLKDVKCFYSKCFSPFLIFLKNSKIQTIFNY